MGTRCQFGYIDNNQGEASYCHEGYIRAAGMTLYHNYTTLEQVKHLVSLGSLSVIGAKPTCTGEPGVASLRTDNPDDTIAYHTFRGDNWKTCEPESFDAPDDLGLRTMENIEDLDQEYLYCFVANAKPGYEWWVAYRLSYKSTEWIWKPLQHHLQELGHIK